MRLNCSEAVSCVSHAEATCTVGKSGMQRRSQTESDRDCEVN